MIDSEGLLLAGHLSRPPAAAHPTTHALVLGPGVPAGPGGAPPAG
ncbi:MAG: hypothetical protein QOD63_1696, partial [Actinomycetota bacterium]|nr:hypothetical protein [Actinomycetota bacterium]